MDRGKEKVSLEGMPRWPMTGVYSHFSQFCVPTHDEDFGVLNVQIRLHFQELKQFIIRPSTLVSMVIGGLRPIAMSRRLEL